MKSGLSHLLHPFTYTLQLSQISSQLSISVPHSLLLYIYLFFCRCFFQIFMLTITILYSFLRLATALYLCPSFPSSIYLSFFCRCFFQIFMLTITILYSFLRLATALYLSFSLSLYPSNIHSFPDDLPFSPFFPSSKYFL